MSRILEQRLGSAVKLSAAERKIGGQEGCWAQRRTAATSMWAHFRFAGCPQFSLGPEPNQSSGSQFIAMMQAAGLRRGYNLAAYTCIHRGHPPLRRFLL